MYFYERQEHAALLQKHSISMALSAIRRKRRAGWFGIHQPTKRCEKKFPEALAIVWDIDGPADSAVAGYRALVGRTRFFHWPKNGRLLLNVIKFTFE